MISFDFVREFALSLPESIELPHFEKTSFRIKNKIFATYGEESDTLCVLLSPEDQHVFCSIDPKAIYPVPNKWGLKGATYIRLNSVQKEILVDALITSYCKIAPKKLALAVRDETKDTNV